MERTLKQPPLFPLEDEQNYFDCLCSAWDVLSGPAWPDRFGKSLRVWATTTQNAPIRTLSLFSGMGGLDIAFHDAGFLITDMVEIEERFAASLSANSNSPSAYLGECHVHCTDIREFAPTLRRDFDFIIGGPPCQTFSAAARRASGVSGLNDDRGTLFQEYVRLLEDLQPRGFLFENVYGITGANGGNAWRKIQAAFLGAGYQVFSRILDTADYGVPQHRERMFIVGLKDGVFAFPRPTHGPDSECGKHYYNAAEAVEGAYVSDEERHAKVSGRYEGLLEQVPPGLNYSYFTEKMGHPNPLFAWRSKFSDFLYKADPMTPIRTLKAQAGQFTGPFHWDNRSFSISEFKRLQTIPDEYKIVGARQKILHQIGNSVPSQVGRILAIAVLDQVFGVSPPCPISYLSQGQTLGFRKRKRNLTSRYRTAAAHGISTLTPTFSETRESERVFSRCLSERFGWDECEGTHSMKVRIETTKEKWLVEVLDKSIRRKAAAIKIHITPTAESWGLPVQRVELVSNAISSKLFTSMWKAFEEELIYSKCKADLVQLCNYYQYRPLIKATLAFKSSAPSEFWGTLSKVCNGVGVRETLPEQELATLWGIDASEVLPTAQLLKSLGYEVRNSNTNQEMPAGYFLIPYFFPTFNPRSVQLSKSLA